MKLDIATVVRGSETPVGQGVTGALRCVIITSAGTHKAAILKRGKDQEIIAESFCAILLRAWGLNTPQPYLVKDDDGFAFASADTGYPNLKQKLGLESVPEGEALNAAIQVACRLATSFKSTPIAIAADEAIGNKDRNLGNILWDGSEVAWIDHAMSLGGGDKLGDINKLAQIVLSSDNYDESIAKSAVAAALTFNKNQIDNTDNAIKENLDSATSAAYVANRITNLASLVIKRFPTSQSLPF